MTTTEFNIHGMGCSGCAASVENALHSVSGVEDVKVELEAARATVTYDESKASADDFAAAVSEAGYTLEK